MDPISVYINWAAYDELSDNVPLTEELAMRQLAELVRLRSFGVSFDYYMMDAFWYEPDGGYRVFRKADWPKGPDRWLEECRRQKVLPGMWFSVNLPVKFNVIDRWKGSHNGKEGLWNSGLCLFDGPYLADFMDALDNWYKKGVRCFKFDFADFNVATPEFAKKLTPEEIKARNIEAFHQALTGFRRAHPQALLLAYNGFGGRYENTSEPFSKTVDHRWLTVFDSLYCGDPRPADVPAWNFWRSKDVYSDHMVLQYLENGIPVERIDNAGFMIGPTGTCYFRGKEDWMAMLTLSLARGGRINTYYGDLALLTDEEARWFGKIQALFFTLSKKAQWQRFGGVPGKAQPYGYAFMDNAGGVLTIVNPTQQEQVVELPRNGRVTLGAEEIRLLGTGEYANLGLGEKEAVSRRLEPVPAVFEKSGNNSITTTIAPQRSHDVRIVFTQSLDGLAFRSKGGAHPNRVSMEKILSLKAFQNGKEMPVQINYDKRIWSGLSWAVGEIREADMVPDTPVKIICASTEEKPLELKGAVYFTSISETGRF